jgi:hypothetical protein
MKKSIGNEIILGGFFGVIAIAASMYEAYLGGFSGAAIGSSIKDISGTMVAVMVFLIAISSIVKKNEKKSIEEMIECSLKEWVGANSNLIVKSKDDDKTGKHGYSMKTDIMDFYRATPMTQNTGWFMRLPKIEKNAYTTGDFKILFHLNKGTFFQGVNLDKDKLKDSLSKLAKTFSSYINGRHGDLATAESKGDQITVVMKPIQNEEDVKNMINVINVIYQAYLVSANIEIK